MASRAVRRCTVGALVRRFTANDLESAVALAGPSPGDTVFVHASLVALGMPSGMTPDQVPARLYASLRSRLGSSGTIVVPTFSNAFCATGRFDLDHSPSERMGAFAEHVRLLPDARRTRHPIQPLAAVGPEAASLAALDTPGGYDAGGPFDRLLALDAWLL